MIAWLKGRPIQLQHHLIMDVQGVGYGVEVGAKTAQKLSGQPEATLFIHSHVREDQFTLFGFETERDKELFELLLSVSGVGPKTALVLVDQGADRLVAAVQNADVAFFSSVPRVGTKLSQKIIIELKSKLGSLQALSLGPTSAVEEDVVAALVALGFSEGDAYRVLPELTTEGVALPVILKQAMKLLSSKSK